MAQILPNTPIASTTTNAMRVFHLLRRLPDNDYFVGRLHLGRSGPDFWVLRAPTGGRC